MSAQFPRRFRQLLLILLGTPLLLAAPPWTGRAAAADEEEGDSEEADSAEADDEEATEETGESPAAAPGGEADPLTDDVLEGGGEEEETITAAEAGEEGGPVAEVDDATVAAGIFGITDIYLTMQKRRDPLERIIVDGPRAEIWFLQAMRGSQAEVEAIRCQAYRWLFYGRLNRSRGVSEVFKQFKQLKEIRLSIFTIETRVKPDGRRGYRQYRKADPKMEIAVGRETALGTDLIKLRPKLQGERCVAEGERAVDKKWYAQLEGSTEPGSDAAAPEQPAEPADQGAEATPAQPEEDPPATTPPSGEPAAGSDDDAATSDDDAAASDEGDDDSGESTEEEQE